MTKRLTITLVALALFVVIAVLPASAILANPATGLFNGSTILNGTPVPTVFIGEDNLNITRVIYGGLFDGTGGGTPANTKIGWWAPGTFSFPDNPSQIVDVGPSMRRFYVDPLVFGPYTGTWYCLTATGSAISTAGAAPFGAAFVVADPSQTVAVIDVAANQGQGQDMTGKSVVRGSNLTIKIATNLAAFTTGGRSNNVTVTSTSTGITYWTNATGSVLNGVTMQFEPPFATALCWSQAGGASSNTPPQTLGVVGTAASIWQVTNGSFWQTTFGPVQVPQTWYFNNTNSQADAGMTAICGQNITGNANGLCGNGQGGHAAFALPPLSAPSVGTVGFNMINTLPNASVDGFITIKIKDESGQVFTRLFTNAAGSVTAPITNRWVNTQPWYLGDFNGMNNGLTLSTAWVTNALDAGTGMPSYPAGTYTVWTESTLSRMKDNYKLGTADYTGKTVSASGTVTLVSDTVKIESNKETVVRSKPFSVTITGRPLTTYWVWVKGTSSMSGAWNNQPPMVGLFQAAVYNDTPTGVTPNNGIYPLGAYAPENSVGVIRALTVAGSDVANDPTIYNRTRYYVLINTSSSGTRTVEFVTSNWTKDQTYTIRVERDSSMPNQGTGAFVNPTPALRDYKSDEVDVKVEKGAVTITAAGDQSYYLGEDIKFSGTNTETQTTFLFITGPNLHTDGSQITNQDPRRSNAAAQVTNNNAGTFKQVAVNADNTWDWKWGTANYALDAGTYTIYAVSTPNDAAHLANSAYGTVSIIIKKPFVSATVSQSTVAQNDKLFITGTAEGKPQQGIAIWVLGKNYATRTTQSVGSDASFSYEVTRAITNAMYAGQYFIVVQHPMQNQRFDIDMCDATGAVTTTGPNVCNFQQGPGAVAPQIFTLLGAGSLQGTDAAEALVQGINSPNVDDTYTKLQFLIEVPVIRVDPVGDRHVGDKFTITAITNLAVDDETLFEVFSSSFKPTQKTQSGEFSGATGTVKVTKGDSGLNKLSFDVDASTFKPDEYLVTVRWVLNTATTGTALFNVLEGYAPTAAPTGVATTAAPTGVATTAAPTTVPATPTKTPTQPGFGALVALIGLGAVAFLVVRKH
jgi:PGF-CTERM protein